jgi:hypothetical protein
VAGNWFWSPSLPSLPSLVMLIVSPTKQFGTRGMHLFFSSLLWCFYFQFDYLLCTSFFFSRADRFGNPGSLEADFDKFCFDEELNELALAVLTYRDTYANISRESEVHVNDLSLPSC